MKADQRRRYQEISERVGNDLFQYYDVGEGPLTVVMLHGAMASKDMMLDLIEELKGKYRCIALDLPGHNGIPIDKGQRTEDIVRYVWNLVESLSLENIVILGYSLGGVIAYSLEHTFRGNSRLRGMVVWSSPLDYKFGLTREGKFVVTGGARLPNRVLHTIKNQNMIHKITKIIRISLSEGFIQAISTFPDKQSRLVSRMIQEGHFDGKTEVPSLFVYDPNDHIVSIENARFLKKNANGKCHVVRIPNGGHYGNAEGRRKACAEIGCFLKGLEKGV